MTSVRMLRQRRQGSDGMRRSLRVLLVAPLLLVTAACGSDGDAGSDGVDTATSAARDTASTRAPDDSSATDTAGTTDTAENADSTAPADAGGGAQAPVGSDGRTATLTLANGETFEFDGLLCSLEAQMSAGSEILFTAVSYGDPGLDVTQFGDDGTVTGVASISVYNGDYETLWEANTMFGSEVELTLEGSTISGTGSFLEGGELSDAPVEGTLVANC